jgi:hypothetical protein
MFWNLAGYVHILHRVVFGIHRDSRVLDSRDLVIIEYPIKV